MGGVGSGRKKGSGSKWKQSMSKNGTTRPVVYSRNGTARPMSDIVMRKLKSFGHKF
jgi:hypothetical protein